MSFHCECSSRKSHCTEDILLNFHSKSKNQGQCDIYLWQLIISTGIKRIRFCSIQKIAMLTSNGNEIL